jgi:hypothetical protein
MLQKLKDFLFRVKRVFTEVETFVKTAGVAILGGGINAVVHDIQSSGHIIFDASHLMTLKASFLGGAATALVFYLCEFPKIKSLRNSTSAARVSAFILCAFLVGHFL